MMIMCMGIYLPPAFLCDVTKSLSFLPYKARNFKNQSNCCPPTFYLDLYQDVTWATHGTCTKYSITLMSYLFKIYVITYNFLTNF